MVDCSNCRWLQDVCNASPACIQSGLKQDTVSTVTTLSNKSFHRATTIKHVTKKNLKNLERLCHSFSLENRFLLIHIDSYWFILIELFIWSIDIYIKRWTSIGSAVHYKTLHHCVHSQRYSHILYKVKQQNLSGESCMFQLRTKGQSLISLKDNFRWKEAELNGGIAAS